tara:strand:- start:175 stop:846 length:672 start_codon:yes stop_codon:yes gene_type:complete
MGGDVDVKKTFACASLFAPHYRTRIVQGGDGRGDTLNMCRLALSDLPHDLVRHIADALLFASPPTGSVDGEGGGGDGVGDDEGCGYDFVLARGARGSSREWMDYVDEAVARSPVGKRAVQYYKAIGVDIRGDRIRNLLVFRFAVSVSGVRRSQNCETRRYACSLCRARLVGVAEWHVCTPVSPLKVENLRKRVRNMLTGQLTALFFVGVLIVRHRCLLPVRDA